MRWTLFKKPQLLTKDGFWKNKEKPPKNTIFGQKILQDFECPKHSLFSIYISLFRLCGAGNTAEEEWYLPNCNSVCKATPATRGLLKKQTGQNTILPGAPCLLTICLSGSFVELNVYFQIKVSPYLLKLCFLLRWTNDRDWGLVLPGLSVPLCFSPILKCPHSVWYKNMVSLANRPDCWKEWSIGEDLYTFEDVLTVTFLGTYLVQNKFLDGAPFLFTVRK